MRRETLYLLDIVEAVEALRRFLFGCSPEGFLADELLRSAVVHKLTIIGEAASRLPREFRLRYPQVMWRDIVDFRNVAVHAYFDLVWPTIWVTATQDAPALGRQVAEILASEAENK
jgi:uncharacterized protein with HEPN domain